MTDTPDDFDTWLVASDTTAQTVPDDVWDATLAGSFDDSCELDDDLTVPPGEEADGTVDGTEVDGDEVEFAFRDDWDSGGPDVDDVGVDDVGVDDVDDPDVDDDPGVDADF